MSEQIQRNAGAQPTHDPDAEYRRALTDDEVRSLGYVGRDKTGRWIHRREVNDLERARERRERARRAAAERACLTCGVTDDRHSGWCWRGAELADTVGAALRDARDLEAAIAWQPKIGLPKLTPPERAQLNKLFAALVARRREGESERPPRKLWSIREWRDHVARREGTA